MKQLHSIVILVIAALIIFNQPSTAAQDSDEQANQIDYIDKVLDHHYLDFQPVGYVQLPRIIYAEDGLHFFRSTESALNSDLGFTDRYYLEEDPIIEDGRIMPATHNLVREEGQPSIILDLSITSHLIWFWLGAIVTMLIFIPLARKYKAGVGRETEPRGALHNMFETFVVFIRDDVARPNLGEDKYQRFVPYLLTAFFFILFMNLFGLLPWGVSSTADLTITVTLALVTFFCTQFFASKDHWKHIFWFPGVPVPIKIMMIPVEIISQFTKPFALCIRLFANMASGKILIFALLGTIFIFDDLFGAGWAYGTSPVWIGLTVFVYIIKAFIAFLQAYVFVVLSALFIGMAIEDHGEHEHAVEHSH